MMVAFEVTQDDLAAVLVGQGRDCRLGDVGWTLDGCSLKFFSAFEVVSGFAARIERAALDAGCELEEQAQAARAEIAAVLAEAPDGLPDGFGFRTRMAFVPGCSFREFTSRFVASLPAAGRDSWACGAGEPLVREIARGLVTRQLEDAYRDLCSASAIEPVF